MSSNESAGRASQPGPISVPVMLPPGDRLDWLPLQALSPRDVLGAHRSAARLSEALIMMVDDELLNIEMTEAFLQEAGYTNFASTDDSRMALALMRQKLPAVLLLDLSMPNVTGMDILESMRADAQLRHIPVIVLTSSLDPQDKLQALAVGAMDFLAKPVDPSELALRLRNTLAAAAYRDFLANHDSLTGLENRPRYERYAAEMIVRCMEGNWAGAVVHLGVDRLGQVNDALGRSMGDQVLQRTAKRLGSAVASESGGELASPFQEPALFRFEGDEFAIVLPRVDSMESAGAFIGKLLSDSASAFSRGGHDLFATCSIGIAMCPQDGRTVQALVGNASLAMRKAKLAGRHRYEFFSPDFNREAAVDLGVAVELRRAFSRHKVELRFLPTMEVARGHLAGVAAVPYWRPVTGDAVWGDDLLDLATTADLGRELAEWSLELVQIALDRWRKAGLGCVPVRLTVALSQISADEMLRLVHRAIKDGLDPNYLVLEWQQGAALDSIAPSELDALMSLARMDVRIGLGGFGSRPSALASVGRLPLLHARIDRSLLAATHARSEHVLRATANFARGMGWACTASGVDSPRQLEAVRSAGVQFYEGPIVSEPIDVASFTSKYLTRQG